MIIHFDVDKSVDDITRTALIHKRQSAFYAVLLRCEINALFKSCRTVRTQIERARSATYVISCKFCGFEYDFVRIVLNTAVCAAHDTCNRNGAVAVANDEHTFVEFVLFSVQSDDGFAVFCVSHNDFAAGEFSLIERVHRLTDFDKHVVCDVHDVVYRSNPHRSQSRFDFLRGRENLDIFHACRHISGAKFLISNVYAHHIRNVYAGQSDLIVDDRFSAIGVECDRNFFCHFVNAVAIGTVCGDADVEDNVVVAQGFECVLTESRTLCKADNIAGFLILNVVFRHAHFFEAAKHTFAQNSAKLSSFYVVTVCKMRSVKSNGDSFAALDGNVGNHLNGFCADVDLSYAQTICVGMFFNLDDFAHDDVCRLIFLINNIFHFKADSHEFFCESRDRNVDVHVVFKP
ncbi:putative uncharacterized protein [Firmicutes bacterium CAG:475]|nr:putative uncharacterized protein [Firmicutes bacterium CAG:475]